MGGGTAMWRLKWDAVDWDGMVSLNWNGDKGEIGLLRTGKLLRWRRDAAERGNGMRLLYTFPLQ